MDLASGSVRISIPTCMSAWSLLPIVGPALRRAEEYTCDRYGVACCQSEADIKAAICLVPLVSR